MSVDFIAIFDISSHAVTPKWLLERRATNQSAIAAVVEGWRDRTPFRAFVTDTGTRDGLRRACLEIADVLGSKRATSMPELTLHQGAGLDEIATSPKELVGPAVEPFDQLEDA